MTDERLRELEQRWKASGSPEDEAAYLLEGVRIGGTLDWDGYQRLAALNVEAAADYLRARVERGDLTQEKLELAAYCSHEPARLVLGEEAPEAPEDIEEWARGLVYLNDPLGVPARAVAVATFAARLGQRLRADLLEHLDAGAIDAAICAAEAWLHCPCAEHGDQASNWADQTVPVDEEGVEDGSPGDGLAWLAAHAANAAAFASLQSVPGVLYDCVEALRNLSHLVPGLSRERIVAAAWPNFLSEPSRP